MSVTSVVVLVGSAREGSLARRLAQAALAPLAAAGVAPDLVCADEHDFPLYNGDLELAHGLPAAVVRLQQRLAAAHGLLVVNPEYNGSVTPLLKNTLDWCSRPNPEDPARSGGAVFAGRAAAVIASSPGPLGGMRVLFHVRDILGYLGMQVIPQQLAVGRAGEAIGADGRLVDERQQAALDALLAALARTAQRLA